jgi:hypothetical protein
LRSKSSRRRALPQNGCLIDEKNIAAKARYVNRDMLRLGQKNGGMKRNFETIPSAAEAALH